ncbi:MAG: FHA domain-containing protein [Actinomycetota bacterium]
MTDLDLRAGQIHRGLGVVARWQDIALVIPSDAEHDATVDEMFYRLGSSPTSPDLVTAINDLLAADELKSVAMVVEATGGPLAMAYGPVEVLVDGELVLTGAGGGVRQQLPQSAQRLTIRAANLTKAAEPVAPYDLRRGIAPGAGLTLITVSAAEPPIPTTSGSLAPSPPVPPSQQPAPAEPILLAEAPGAQPAGAGPDAGSPAGEPWPDLPTVAPSEVAVAAPAADAQPPADVPPPGVRSGRFDEDGDAGNAPQAERAQPALPPAPLSVPFRSVLLTDTAPPADVVPLPLADAPRTGELSRSGLDAGRVEVQGIVCQRGHFNNPAAANCMICGLSMLHLTQNLVKGPRPTLGFIVFDDGSTFGLDRSYLIGREPIQPEGEDAELLILNQNNETLSRTHAELRLVDWAVQLIDLGSTDGTYVWDAAFERWNQLAPNQPVVLSSGDTVALGRRTLVFEGVSRV